MREHRHRPVIYNHKDAYACLDVSLGWYILREIIVRADVV